MTLVKFEGGGLGLVVLGLRTKRKTISTRLR